MSVNEGGSVDEMYVGVAEQLGLTVGNMQIVKRHQND